MPRTLPVLLSIALLASALTAAAASADGARKPAVETQTLTGEYVWENRGRSGPLRAEFTAAGEGEWKVAFHFKFRGDKHIYEGTARGSLSEGALKGTVKNENKRRTFTFEGSFEDGAFSGTHAEVDGSSEYSTGTLTLSR